MQLAGPSHHAAADVLKLVVRNAMAIFLSYVTESCLRHVLGVSLIHDMIAITERIERGKGPGLGMAFVSRPGGDG